jgi:hypothetical protein
MFHRVYVSFDVSLILRTLILMDTRRVRGKVVLDIVESRKLRHIFSEAGAPGCCWIAQYYWHCFTPPNLQSSFIRSLFHVSRQRVAISFNLPFHYHGWPVQNRDNRSQSHRKRVRCLPYIFQINLPKVRRPAILGSVRCDR